MNTAILPATTSETGRANLSAVPTPSSARDNFQSRVGPDGDAGLQPQKTNRGKSFKRAVLVALLVFAGIGITKFGYNWWAIGRFIESTDDAYIGGDVTVIAPKVAGFISQLAVTDNQPVHAGDLLVKLDDRDYRAALAKADAAVAIQQATLANLEATHHLQESVIAQAQAGIAVADAEITRTRDDQARSKQLLAGSVESLQSFQRADADYKEAIATGQKARAAVDAAQQQLAVIETQKQQVRASLAQATAECELAQLNLSYTELRAPIDGVVGNRSAQTGAYATTGSQLISLVPAHGLWIDANFKESQLALVRPGAPATVEVDSLPGKLFHGHVASIAPATGAQFSVLPPENATGNFTKIVQRVTVRILLDDETVAPGQLRPGLFSDGKSEWKEWLMNAAVLPPPFRFWDIFPFVVMCIGMFMALLDIQIVASSLQDIGGGLSAAQDQISWVQTSYLIAEIIMIPLSGWLTRVFSTRWLFTVSAAGFTVTSLLCGLAWNIESMIVFRALQGLLGASMIPTVFTSSFHYFQGVRRVYSAAVIGTIASVAPTLGPVIGGWITDTLNWHWLFYINLIPGITVTVLIPFLVKIDEPDFSLLKGADYPGIVLMAIGLGSLQYVLEEGARWNWFDDSTITVFTLIAGATGILFIIRSLTFARPVVDLRALGNRNFLLGCILSFITGVGIFATIFLTPLFLGYVRGYSAWQTGVAIASTGAASLAGVPIYILLARKFDIRWLMMFGLACFSLSMWNFSFITHDWGWRELLLPQILRGFPQVFVVAPAVNLGLGSLSPERLKYASGLFNMMRNLGGAIGIAACGTILNDRANLHFLRLAEHLNATNATMQEMLHRVSAHFAALKGGDLVHGQVAALKQLWSLAWREAQVQTFADAFLAIAACLAFATVLVPLLRKVGAPATPAADAH